MASVTPGLTAVQPEPPGPACADALDRIDLAALDFALPEDEWIDLDGPADPAPHDGPTPEEAAWLAEADAEREDREAALDQARYEELLEELHQLRSGQAFPEAWHEIEVIEAAGSSALARSPG